MTKLEGLINEYYATDDISLSDHISDMLSEMSREEVLNELVTLLHHLKRVV